MNDDRLSRLCGCKTKAAFNKSLRYLISEGKITETDGGLFNKRVEKEIKKATEISSKAKRAAESRWEKKPNKNNACNHATASPKHMPQVCQLELEPDKEKELPNGSYKNTKKSRSNSVQNSLSPQRENELNELNELFEEIWKSYPRKVGKQAALEAFRKAIKRADLPSVILPALHEFCEAHQTSEKQFIPHLSTWLKNHRWTDDQSHSCNTAPTSQERMRALSAPSRGPDPAQMQQLFPRPKTPLPAPEDSRCTTNNGRKKYFTGFLETPKSPMVF